MKRITFLPFLLLVITLTLASCEEDKYADWKILNKQWIEKYFGDIKPSAQVEPLKPIPVTLTEWKRAVYEDNFAQSPELTMLFPTVEQFNDLVGEKAAQILIQKIINPKEPVKQIRIEAKLIVPDEMEVFRFEN